MTNLKALHAAKSVAREPYAWPGGYPRHLVMHDGGILCPACCKAEFKLICHSALTDARDGWQPEGADIHWEGLPLVCDHCGAEIPSAYGCPEDDGAE